MRIADLGLSEAELGELQVRARYRVIEGFKWATEPNPRRRIVRPGSPRCRGAVRGTDNAIVGCADGKVSTLADYILRQAPRGTRRIISEEMVAALFDERVAPPLLRNAAADLNYELFCMAICAMRESHEVCYLEGNGLWQMPQAVVHRHNELRQAVKSSRVFVNAQAV